jgi:cytosine/adenosine deaminase-related metal-dependent hydrolase
MLQGKLRHGAAAMSARDALEIATRGGAACLGRTGEIGQLSVGACGDLAVWSLEGVRFAGALSDPVEAWLRCGPVSARQTVVGGRFVVDDGVLVHPGLDEQLAVHRRVSQRMQAALA